MFAYGGNYARFGLYILGCIAVVALIPILYVLYLIFSDLIKNFFFELENRKKQ